MRVGSDIEAVCKKCGDVWHVVIALADRVIAKVECRECGPGTATVMPTPLYPPHSEAWGLLGRLGLLVNELLRESPCIP